MWRPNRSRVFCQESRGLTHLGSATPKVPGGVAQGSSSPSFRRSPVHGSKASLGEYIRAWSSYCGDDYRYGIGLVAFRIAIPVNSVSDLGKSDITSRSPPSSPLLVSLIHKLVAQSFEPHGAILTRALPSSRSQTPSGLRSCAARAEQPASEM